MKFIALMLCGLFSLATAYPYPKGELARVEHDPAVSGCIILEYHLGYVSKEFRVCKYPADCISLESACQQGRQYTQLGAPQYIFMNNFHAMQLFGGFTGFCLRATPPLPTCSSLPLDDIAGDMQQNDDEGEGEVCVTDEDTGERICTPLGVSRKF